MSDPVSPNPAAAKGGDKPNCMSRSDAEDVVFGCVGKDVKVDTKLGDLFPNPEIRRNFCGCVVKAAKAKEVDVDVPCNPSTTIEDVIEALTC